MKDQSWGIDYKSFFVFDQNKSQIKDFSLGEKKLLDSLIDFYAPGKLQKYIEKTAAYFYSFLSEKTRTMFSSFVKKNTASKVKNILNLIPAKEIEEFGRIFENREYNGHKSTILITHDVDYLKGYESVLEIARMEASLGLKASYYFLVHAGYKISSEVLKQLVELGHEIGVHGYAYDLRLAYRGQAEIAKQLKKAKQELETLTGEKVYGFRNHSLRNSVNMLQAVQEAGFIYESGVYPIKKINNFNTFFCWPFKYAQKELVEIPVTWPMDTEVFRNLNLTDEQALDFYKEKIGLITKLHGVVCLNQHPEIIIGHKVFYQNLLEFIANSNSYNTRPIDLAKNYISKEK
ncbi:MAG: polysaccharide deacetylase family protein [Candidatus Berkelbacteria bacterium]